jgi:hypothetical protein
MWLKKAITVDYIDNLLRDKKYLQALAVIADAGGDKNYPDIDTILENAFDQIYISPTDDPALELNKRMLQAVVTRLGLQAEYDEIIRLLKEELDEEQSAGDVWDEEGHKRY